MHRLILFLMSLPVLDWRVQLMLDRVRFRTFSRK
jgi:hypothetical protein